MLLVHALGPDQPIGTTGAHHLSDPSFGYRMYILRRAGDDVQQSQGNNSGGSGGEFFHERLRPYSSEFPIGTDQPRPKLAGLRR